MWLLNRDKYKRIFLSTVSPIPAPLKQTRQTTKKKNHLLRTDFHNIRHSNIYQILVRITDAIIWRISGRKARITVPRLVHRTRLLLLLLLLLLLRCFPRFSSSNLATWPCRSVSLRGTRKPFLSWALCVYPLSTFLLFSTLGFAFERVSFSSTDGSITGEQVVNVVRK